MPLASVIIAALLHCLVDRRRLSPNTARLPTRALGQTEGRAAPEHSRTITFVIVFWGEKFRRLFLDYCLASLMAPQNLPFIATEEAHDIKAKFIICSTAEDYAALAEEPMFALLRHYAEVSLIDIGLPGATLMMLHMSKGHKAALQRCIEEKSYCSVLAPDIILANGSVRKLIEIVDRKHPLALFPGFRFDFDEVCARLDAGGYIVHGAPLTIDRRPLAAIASESLHSEIERFEFDSAHFNDYPNSTIFRRPGNGLVLHTVSWGIALADFSYLGTLSDEHFDTDTIDAHFVNDHLFGRAEFGDPVILNDSDDYLMVPLTTEADMPQKHFLRPNPLYLHRPAAQVEDIKIGFIRSLLFSPASDAFKRWSYQISVNIHAEPLPAGGDTLKERAGTIVARAIATSSLSAPVYLMVAVCSPNERDQLWRLLLPSLRSPNNAPVLAQIPGCRLLIATTAALKEEISRGYVLHLLSYFLAIEFVEIEDFDARDPPETNTARGLALCAARCIKDGAFGSILRPDAILSDGTVRRVAELMNQGCEGAVVLAPRFRFDARRRESDKFIDGQPIVLSGRQVTAGILECVEPGFLESSPRKGGSPYYVRTADGFVARDRNWAVLLCDFRAMRQDAAGSPRGSGVDEAALHRALLGMHQRGKLHIVADADEVCYLAITESADAPGGRDIADDPLTRLLASAAVSFHADADVASAAGRPDSVSSPLQCIAAFVGRRRARPGYFYAWQIPWARDPKEEILAILKKTPTAPLRWVLLLLLGAWFYRGRILRLSGALMRGDRTAVDWLRARLKGAAWFIGRSAAR
ncbi:MAG TPA: hypothetical protein VGL83_09710 [Stellaceae bacterium]